VYKVACDGIPNGLLKQTKLFKIREQRVPGNMKRRPKKSWDKVVKDDMKKRGLCNVHQ